MTLTQAQKRSPFSQLSQNEMAKEFYQLGFFNPEMAQQSLVCLEMMDFEGKDKIVQQIQQGQTLLNVLQTVTQQRDALASQMGLAQRRICSRLRPSSRNL